MANLPLGIGGGLALFTVPQLLAGAARARTHHRWSHRLWACWPRPAPSCSDPCWMCGCEPSGLRGIVVTLLSAGSTVFAFLDIGNLSVLSWAVIGQVFFPEVDADTVGGWFGSLEVEGGGRPAGAMDDHRQYGQIRRHRHGGDPSLPGNHADAGRLRAGRSGSDPAAGGRRAHPAAGAGQAPCGREFGRICARRGGDGPQARGWQLLVLFGLPPASSPYRHARRPRARLSGLGGLRRHRRRGGGHASRVSRVPDRVPAGAPLRRAASSIFRRCVGRALHTQS